MRPALLAQFGRAVRLLVQSPRHFLLRARQYVASTHVLGHPSLPSYADWFSDHLPARAQDYPAPLAQPNFSILTTVYEKTDVILLQETAQAIFAQTFTFHEWLILAHGPVSEGVDQLLTSLEHHPHVFVYRLPQNLGIMGGMRFCLERASGNYIVPMDGDDLLTPDALQIMAAVIARDEQPAILYSDEDTIIKNVFKAPYLRPDWDPILNLAGSYIWHLCVFRRDMALQLDVYTDAGSNWCHDWDTIFRFSNAGYIPLHIPEVLYHWRQHSASSTNRADPDSGSIRSARYLLEQQVALLPNQNCYTIEAFPIFRGAQEWYIKRCPCMGIAMDIILVARSIRRSLKTLHSMLKNTSYPFGSVIVCINEEPNEKLKARFERCIRNAFVNDVAAIEKINVQLVPSNKLYGIKIASSKVTSPLILFCSDAIEVDDENWSWEALKQIELHYDVAMVGGRLLKGNRIIDGGRVFEENGQLVLQDRGQSADAGGYYSLSLKPHTVNAVPLDFFVARRDFLTSAISSLPDTVHLSHLSMWLAGVALEQKLRVAFSPLINVVLRGDILGATKDNESKSECEDFSFLYGHMVKNRQWAPSRYSNLQKICRLM